jgi:hypothetical protein
VVESRGDRKAESLAVLKNQFTPKGRVHHGRLKPPKMDGQKWPVSNDWGATSDKFEWKTVTPLVAVQGRITVCSYIY